MGPEGGDLVSVIGRLRINPPLNQAELEYLIAFAESRRWQRAGGPYAVPDHPLAECGDALAECGDIERDPAAYGVPALGQPGLLCCWRPDPGGATLIPVAPPASTAVCAGAGAADELVHWLAYLRDHFLAPGARAAGLGAFAGFSFDHLLNGAVAVFRADTGRLGLVRVADNVISLSWPAPDVPAPDVGSAA